MLASAGGFDVSGAARNNILASGGGAPTSKSSKAQLFKNFFHRPSHRNNSSLTELNQLIKDVPMCPPCPLANFAFSAESIVKPMSIKMHYSSRTEIGGMAENQDEHFIWRPDSGMSVVLGVLDGHGRDVGKLAALHVKNFMQDWLSRHWSAVITNPAESFKAMFADSHSSMMIAFQQRLTADGWTVKESGGYLMKRRSMSCPWSCVHGGTSGTIIAIIEGKGMIVANVGDSSALLACRGRILRQNDLVQCSLWPEYGGIIDTCPEAGTVSDGKNSTGTRITQTLLLTTDHSPESLREYRRLKCTFPCPQNSELPHLSIVYDSPTPNKLRCPPVFQLNASGNPFVTGNGRYFKNVRREWASLVATPPRARFQDALAFTRSIGDFHLQCYGVCHVPDVHTLDLSSVFIRPQNETPIDKAFDDQTVTLKPVFEEIPKGMVSCVVVCSDGVWDNWLFADVSAFFLNSQRISQVMTAGNCDGVVHEFMMENMRRSASNFGNQADNATAVACYIFMEEQP